VTGGRGGLYNEALHDLYSSLSIIRMINSRRMRRAGHIARMGEKRNAYIQGVSKKSFATVFQMLLCGECYENIHT
jgi:hypothetical protein